MAFLLQVFPILSYFICEEENDMIHNLSIEPAEKQPHIMDIMTIFIIEMDPLINCQLLIYCEKTSTANCPRKIYWINLAYFNNPLAPVYGGI